MAETRSSIRIRASLRDDLRLLAAELARWRDMPMTMVSLLEEGVEGLFQTPLAQWVAWAKEGRASVLVGEPSLSFRIRSDLSKNLGILAAQISKQSAIPITKIHLIEEAGRRIADQVKTELKELEELEQSLTVEIETRSAKLHRTPANS